MKPTKINRFFPLILLFILANIFIWVFSDFMVSKNINVEFIFGANIVLFIITFAGFIIQTRGVASANINAFLRGIYTSLLLKMFIVMGAVFFYVLAADGNVNQAALFISMGLYVIYTAVEVTQLMKIARKKPDA